MNTPVGVLRSIAKLCRCDYDDIEKTLTERGYGSRYFKERYDDPFERLTAIRRAVATPEAGSVLDNVATIMAEGTGFEPATPGGVTV